MHILHISNSYGGTAVYKNLYSQLDGLGIRQTIYVPLNYKNRDRIGNQMINFNTNGSKIIYSTVLRPWHRVLYMAKINRIVEDVLRQVDLATIDAIHASTLCLDGAVAFKIRQKAGIPYMVAVRNTDVNSYYKTFIWRRGFFSKILLDASKIVFISPKYKEGFLSQTISQRMAQTIENRVVVIPNGIDSYFFENRVQNIKKMGRIVKLIFISAFKTGKGLIETIRALDLLRTKGYEVTLRAIGRGLPNRGNDDKYLTEIEKLAQNRQWLTLENFKQAPELCKALREADIFVMPSKPETFGLVYVEALSQNIPIIYGKGQGFDGFFPDGVVGYPAEAGNEHDIADKIELIMNNYATISQNICETDLNGTFDWSTIAKHYIDIYKKIIL